MCKGKVYVKFNSPRYNYRKKPSKINLLSQLINIITIIKNN